MNFNGFFESVNGYSSPLIIIKSNIEYKFKLNSDVFGKKEFKKYEDFLIYSNSDNFILKSNNELYKINITDDIIINLEYQDISLNNLVNTYKGLKLPEKIFNINKEVKNLKVKVYEIMDNQNLEIIGINDDSNVIKVKKISIISY